MKRIIALGAAALVTVACSGNCSKKVTNVTFDKKDEKPMEKTTEEPLKQEDSKMTTENMIKTSSGLQYKDIVQGSGRSPERGDVVVVHYTGWLEGKPGEPDMTRKFDSSVDRNDKFEFVIGVGQVIRGWDEGVASMKIGGKRRLVIPSELGYGARGAGSKIPGGATLVFDVELFDIR